MASKSSSPKSGTKAKDEKSRLGPICIGITGHRRHRLHVPDDTLMARMCGVIADLRGKPRSKSQRDITIVSALAEGADELAAKAALKCDCRFFALLPFAPKAYETTFSSKGYVKTFRALLAEADETLILPGTLDQAEDGYVAVGEATLDRSDVVLTVWDGAPGGC